MLAPAIVAAAAIALVALPARAEDAPVPAPPSTAEPAPPQVDPWWPYGPPGNPEEIPPPAPRPHVGLFARVDGGFAYAGADLAYPGEGDVTLASLEGGAGTFGLSVGWAPSPDFIIAVELWGVAFIDPTLSPRASTAPAGAFLSAVGVQFTWYWQPANIYLSTTPALSLLRVKLDGDWYAARLGFGLKTSFGWEWRVAPGWGVGPALQVIFSVNDNDGTPQTLQWLTGTFGIAVSATYD
jgi:hypothetical protein